jgi:hypothetical protein
MRDVPRYSRVSFRKEEQPIRHFENGFRLVRHWSSLTPLSSAISICHLAGQAHQSLFFVSSVPVSNRKRPSQFMKEFQARKRMPKLIWSLFAWIAVWCFWLTLTRGFHPSFSLAVIATTSLVGFYAIAAYTNHLVLVPRLCSHGVGWSYLISMAAVMALLTALALAIIRISYLVTLGSDPDPYGLYKHYAIDLFGMVVHVGLASLAVRLTQGR